VHRRTRHREAETSQVAWAVAGTLIQLSRRLGDLGFWTHHETVAPALRRPARASRRRHSTSITAARSRGARPNRSIKALGRRTTRSVVARAPVLIVKASTT
jgi:hypothetical protein